MARKKATNVNAELRTFLRKHPKTHEMEVLIADLPGTLRGKRIRRHEFEKTFQDGFCLPGGTVLLDTIGDVISNIPWSDRDGDPDINAFIVPGSLSAVPWAKKPAAQAMYRFFTRDGKPFFADPRHVLERSAAPLQKMGLKIVMATELEFYLLDAKADRPTPRVSRVPGIGRPQPGPQVYSPDDLWDIENFLNDLHAVCETQNIPSGTTTSEFAPGQFEINLHHVDNPALACDHAVLLKRAIKAVARQHGFVACFMAKPFAEDAGSGMHVHMSLVDKNGKNYFSQGKEKMALPPFSARFRRQSVTREFSRHQKILRRLCRMAITISPSSSMTWKPREPRSGPKFTSLFRSKRDGSMSSWDAGSRLQTSVSTSPTGLALQSAQAQNCPGSN